MKHLYSLSLSVFLLAANMGSPLSEPPKECIPPTAREERDLFSQISSESRRLYNALDCEGKRRALELASSSENKNQAIQDAAKEMAKRRAEMYRNQRTYPQKEGVRQEDYGRRYGY